MWARHRRVLLGHHWGDEPYAGAEGADHVAGVESLTQLAPVRQVGLGHPLARLDVPTRGRPTASRGREQGWSCSLTRRPGYLAKGTLILWTPDTPWPSCTMTNAASAR